MVSYLACGTILPMWCWVNLCLLVGCVDSGIDPVLRSAETLACRMQVQQDHRPQARVCGMEVAWHAKVEAEYDRKVPKCERE